MDFSNFFSEDSNTFKHVHISIWTVIALLILFVLYFILLRLIKKAVRKSRVERSRKFSIYRLLKYVVLVITLIMCLQVIGVDVTLLIAGSAALLVGLSLGIQQLFNDWVSGVLLLFEGTIRINDVVEIDGMVCRVTNIKLRYSTVINRDDVLIIVPNHRFISEKVTNWTRDTKIARFYILVHVAYGSDIALVKNIAYHAMVSHPDVSKQFEPLVRLKNFGEYALEFELLFWSDVVFQIQNIESDIRIDIATQFSKNNIIIPVPQRDIKIRN